MRVTYFFALFLASSAIATIYHDGEQVGGPGIITQGCIYGINESVSDHAPIVFTTHKIATWNITSRISHQVMKKGSQVFLNHKFKTNAQHVVVNAHGQPAIQGFSSETNQNDVVQENTSYETRLKNIANKIKLMFRDYQLNAMALQEIPRKNALTLDGRSLRTIFDNALQPELTIDYPEQLTGRFETDVALVSPTGNALRKMRGNAAMRFQPYCDDEKKSCTIVIHLPFTVPKHLINHCQTLKEVVRAFFKDGMTRILVVGDFNTSAEDLKKHCSRLPSFKPIITTYRQKPISCKDNEGHTSNRRIDLLLDFKKPRRNSRRR